MCVHSGYLLIIADLHHYWNCCALAQAGAMLTISRHQHCHGLDEKHKPNQNTRQSSS